ncbi:Fe/S biogenesis protein NfuA [bacterium HR10]|uniref:Nitrogen fixation protein NifU n=1 Tax=uncultured Acidobacteriota bacterium TaxID=171953 RepID=H5SPR6_9BACT|nr:nitrogen fixation protein NifU [uncultured Acidobacteriota bacterium]GBC81652.1 Fe/S biogenesis protein NfuA [bacterium HR10]
MDEIKIMAEIQPDPSKCRFTVDRPVYEGAAYFRSREEARGSPLAEAIFAVSDQISAVLISGNIITVTKEDFEDWVPVARQIGAAIRQVLRSGVPPVSEEVRARRASSEEIRRKVQELLDNYINPAVAAHGGFVELIDVIDQDVFLRMGGGCQGCGAANITLKMGIEEIIREHIPEVGNIFDTTDHAAGRNPYYSPYGW